VAINNGSAALTYYAGGSRHYPWTNPPPGVETGLPAITETIIAQCLEVDVNQITNLEQNGADGNYERDNYMGFRFDLGTPAFQYTAGPQKIEIGTYGMATDILHPTAPRSLIATAGNGQVSVAFTASYDDGGATITGYEYELDGDGTWVSAGATTTTPVVVTGLDNGTEYSIKLRAVNSKGTGTESANATFTTADTVAPTVLLTGPSEIVTGAFEVSAAFSEDVTGLEEGDITVENGTVTALIGVDTDYTITIEPDLGATVTVFIVAGAAQDGADNGNIVSNTYTIQAGSPASAFEEHEEEILEVVTAEALRSVRATVSSNVRMTRAARERFMLGRQQADTDSQMVSRAATPLDITGSAELSNGRFSTQGTFFGETGNAEGGQTRLFFGDFDVQRDADGSVSAQLNTKLAWERQISTTAMYGYYLGAELGRATLEGAFAGDQDSFGASVGAYFVAEVQPNLYLDGFASLGLGRSALELDNGTLNVTSDYTTTTGTVGASLTGVVEGDGYEFWPQLQLTYGQTDIGMMTFTGEAYSLVDDTLSMDAGSVSMASGAFTAEFKVPLDGLSVSDSHALFTFAPRLICERTMAADTTNDCGGGAEIGIVSRSSDGLSNLSVNIRSDRVGDTTRTGLGLQFERSF
jgi:hypothetical protein